MKANTRHISGMLQLASQADIFEGLDWYDRAYNLAVRFIHTYDGLTMGQAVGVIAALSPNNRWERNKVDAYNMCSAFVEGLDWNAFKVSTYNTMKAKAWSILEYGLTDDDDILERLNGQKIRSFYSNIMGLDEITVDGHALNIARGYRVGLTDDATNIGVKLYRDLQAAYVRAAARAGVKPHEMQAITWTAWKRVHNI